MSFFNRFKKQSQVEPEVVPSPEPPPAARARGFVPPPPRESPQASTDPREARLLQRIQGLEDEIEAVERSGDPDSPFQQRIAVLAAALDAVEREIAMTTPHAPRELPSLPATPITNVEVTLEPVPQVSFSIGPSRFSYAEEIDWAERGTQIVRGDLIGNGIEPAALIPDSISGELRDELEAHLERSLFGLATELRDRTVEGRPIPEGVTLADLAVPSPQCGDWELWGGVSLRCLEHETRLRELNAERTRLLNERGAEIEERQRQVEELPIQRRRLNQAIADLQALSR
jgi:hypothetical protein